MYVNCKRSVTRGDLVSESIKIQSFPECETNLPGFELSHKGYEHGEALSPARREQRRFKLSRPSENQSCYAPPGEAENRRKANGRLIKVLE